MDVEEGVERLLRQFPGYLTLIDRSGRIAWNASYAYGHHAGTLLHQPADTAVHPDDRAKWWRMFSRALNQREVIRYTIRLLVPAAGATPGTVTLEGRMGPVVVGDEVKYVACITWDVTGCDPFACDGCAAAEVRHRQMPSPTGPSSAPVPVPSVPTSAARLYSPLEERIVTGLRGRGWMVTADLAASIGEEPSSEFRVVVRNLMERGTLETSQKHGVRLAANS